MFRTRIISGLDEFRDCSADWDRLWADSNSHMALHRAQALINFVEAFAKSEDFAVVVAENARQWYTGIPLLLKRNRFGQLIGLSPANEWSVRDCILDVGGGSPERFAAIEKGFRELGLSSIQLPWCSLNQAGAQALIAGWESRGRQVSIRPRFFVGQFDLQDDWSAYWTGLSRNRRKKLQKGLKELGKQGGVEFVACSAADQASLIQAFETSLQIELASWKGEQCSSILNHPQVAKYFRSNAAHFADCGLLRVYLLKVEGRPIAFDFGFIANGVYTAHKVSYLNEFAACSPGQLLTIKMIEHFYHTGDARAIDFLGPLAGASEPWANSQYPVGKLTLSGGTMISDLSVLTIGKITEILRPCTLKI
jgi:hypothetical protein